MVNCLSLKHAYSKFSYGRYAIAYYYYAYYKPACYITKHIASHVPDSSIGYDRVLQMWIVDT